jgi:Domain of unknown function (DUF2703)
MHSARSNAPFPLRRLEIELIALDLDTCTRCTGTAANIRAAVASAADVLREAGAEVVFRQVIVRTAEEAERVRLEISPTVRINGKDITDELRETTCVDCSDLCGCGSDVTCRVWVWRGTEFPEAPTGMILNALLTAFGQADHSSELESTPFRLPNQLRDFFEVRGKLAAAGEGCCNEATCCEPSEKTTCCSESALSRGCGCQ